MISFIRSRRENRALRDELKRKEIIERQASDFLNTLKEGNHSAMIGAELAATDLGRTIQAISVHLTTVSKIEEERNWVNVGLAKFADVLRNKNGLQLKDLTYEILLNVIKYLEINQGAIFIVEGNADHYSMELSACYAYDRKKFITRKIEMGEGLVGQCVVEKDIIYLKKSPQNYTKITSGLGEATPREILICPLMVNDTVFGVIELASFTEFSETKIQFVKRLSENVAAAIKNVKENERVVTLLNSSQQQTEALRAQEEELRQNMEELQATQEEMQRKTNEISRSSAEMMSIMKGIDATMATIEFKPDGTIVTANANFLKSVGYTIDQIKNKHHKIFVPNELANSDDYKMFWDKLASGKSLSGTFKRKTSTGNTVWLNAIYNPIYDHNDKVVKVVKFATDITAQQELIAESSGVMDGVNSTMAVITFSPTGIIMDANEKFSQIMGYSVDELRGKHHKMFITPELAESVDYKVFWNQLENGQSLKGVFKRLAADGSTVSLNAIYNPIKNADGQVVKVVKFATSIGKTEEVKEGKLVYLT
jgi:PAS domain S-box-containing protein